MWGRAVSNLRQKKKRKSRKIIVRFGVGNYYSNNNNNWRTVRRICNVLVSLLSIDRRRPARIILFVRVPGKLFDLLVYMWKIYCIYIPNIIRTYGNTINLCRPFWCINRARPRIRTCTVQPTRLPLSCVRRVRRIINRPDWSTAPIETRPPPLSSPLSLVIQPYCTVCFRY